MGKSFLFIFLLFPIFAFATTTQHPTKHKSKTVKTTKKSVTKSEKKPAEESNTVVKLTGYIDGSYNYLPKNYFTSGVFDRTFDNVPNGFTLHQAALTYAIQPAEGLGMLINPVMGYDTNIFASYGFMPIREFDSQTFSIDVPQAYVQYAIKKLTLSGGRYTELAGAEGLDPTQDSNFSRGFLYDFAEPFTVTGLRATYAYNDKLTFIAGINNGWDNIRDWSRKKTIELNTTYIVSKFFSFAGTVYSGQERVTPFTDSGPTGWRTLIDLIGTWNFTDKLSFVANYDYGWQTNAALPNGTSNRAVWHGIAGYLNYQFSDCWKTSLRGEYFNDRNGFRTGVRQALKEATLSLGYIPLKNLEFRGEVRHDFSNVNSFTNKNVTTTSNNIQSYALEGFYKFG